MTGTLTGTGYRRITPYRAEPPLRSGFFTASHRITLKESAYESEGRTGSSSAERAKEIPGFAGEK
jgi:hypothetical protein